MAALGVVLCSVYLGAELFVVEELAFPLDDSWIHLQFAHHLAAGNGLSFQGDRQVAGSTAPLWTALLALAAWAPSFAVLWSKLLGAVAYVLSLLVLLRLARRMGLSTWATRLAAVLVAATDWMVWSALSGMEIPLFVLLSLLGMDAHLADRSSDADSPSRFPWATLWLSLACLARPEGLLLLLLSWVDAAFEVRLDGADVAVLPRRHFLRRLPVHLALALVVLAPVGAYFMAISGSPLPTTFSVKSGTERTFVPSSRHLWEMVRVFFQPLPFMVLFAGAGIVASLRAAARGLLPMFWLLALPLAYGVLAGSGRPNLGNFGRYLFPLLPLVALVGCHGLQTLLRGAPERFGVLGLTLRTRLWIAVLVVLPTALGCVAGLQRYVTSVANVTDSDVAVARWVRDHLPPDARLGVQDIGAMAYIAPQPLVDMVGIVNPEILPYLRGDKVGDHPTLLQGWAEFMTRSGVDFLVMFPRSYGGIGAIEQVMPGLAPVHSVRLERNITMAADELVVYATPWGRAGGSAGNQVQDEDDRQAPSGQIE